MPKFWSIVFGLVLFLCGLSFVIAPMMGWWLPKNVSTFGPAVDNLFYLILGITGFFFILTEALLVYNMWAYTHKEGEKSLYIHSHHGLEIFWTAVPGAILLLLAILQISTWAEIKYQSSMPDPDVIMEVSARQFEWRVRYPNEPEQKELVKQGPQGWEKGKPPPARVRSWVDAPHLDDIHVVNEIHTWQNAKVRVYLKTQDVLHSFYLPNLRLKQDAVPGKVIPVWFQVDKDYNTAYDPKLKRWVDGFDPSTGKHDQPHQVWDLACAELCGWGHYKMQGRLFVHKDKEDYLSWLKYAREEQNRTKP
ncbi:MAG: cytochrome c oxidase subunit II [Gemmataceae bacterium]